MSNETEYTISEASKVLQNANLIKKYHLTSYFPSKDSEEETGSKRGMVLLCKDDQVCAILEKNTNLQKNQL